MSYNGEWLMKAGNEIIPNKYIAAETYKVKPKQRQDLDPYRDLTGYLHRNVVPNMPTLITFSLPAIYESRYVYDRTLQEFLGILRRNWINESEHKFRLTYYNMLDGNYTSEDVYMPDPEFNIYGIFNGQILYNPTQIQFIGY